MARPAVDASAAERFFRCALRRCCPATLMRGFVWFWLRSARRVIDHAGFADRESFDAALAEAIDAHSAISSVAAGFTGFDGRFCAEARDRMVSIHPSLLGLHGLAGAPSGYGAGCQGAWLYRAFCDACARSGTNYRWAPRGLTYSMATMRFRLRRGFCCRIGCIRRWCAGWPKRCMRLV